MNGATLSNLAVGQEPQFLELVRGQQVRFVDGDDDIPSAFVFLGGEVVHGLGDQAGGVEPGDAAEAGDQRGVEAAGADGRVRQVDHGVAGRVEFGEGGAERDGFPGADFTGDHAERGFVDAPADPGDRFGVPGVAVQHPGCEVTAERGAGETVEGAQLVQAHPVTSTRSAAAADVWAARVSRSAS